MKVRKFKISKSCHLIFGKLFPYHTKPNAVQKTPCIKYVLIFVINHLGSICQRFRISKAGKLVFDDGNTYYVLQVIRYKIIVQIILNLLMRIIDTKSTQNIIWFFCKFNTFTVGLMSYSGKYLSTTNQWFKKIKEIMNFVCFSWN